MTLKIGHRGAAGYEPENTLRSFRKALELGANMVEFDVHLCASEEVVVIHDETVNRTTNGTGRVADMTIQELKRLDAGQDERIPTLDEVLNDLAARTAVNIELKAAGTAEPVSAKIRRAVEKGTWKADQFMVSSFNHEALARFKKLYPDIRTGVLFGRPPENLAAIIQSTGAWSLNAHKSAVTEAFIRDAHAKHLKVIAWTVNSLEEIAALNDLGVDGIASDFPDRLGE